MDYPSFRTDVSQRCEVVVILIARRGMGFLRKQCWAAGIQNLTQVALVCRRLGGEFEAGDFYFQSAEVGVVVFADFVGYVDKAALL